MSQVAPDPGYNPAFYNPPPPPGPVPVAPSVVVVQQTSGGLAPAAVPGDRAQYREAAVLVVCQFCGATVTTSTRYVVGMFTFVVALVLILLGLWMGCCLIPFCMDSCKDIMHDCPNCKQNVGQYHKHM